MLLRILVVIPIGFIAACLAAGAFFILATIGVGPDWSYFTLYWPETSLLVGAIAAWAGALAAIPATVAILAAEVFRWRSVLFYILAGAFIGGAIEIASFSGGSSSADTDAPLLLATGCVAGLIYWLIAGRGAGFAIAKPESHL